MKPTKICRMVKIRLQFAIKLFFDDADVEFLSWCGSIYIPFQNFCENDTVQDFINLVFAPVLNRQNKILGI